MAESATGSVQVKASSTHRDGDVVERLVAAGCSPEGEEQGEITRPRFDFSTLQDRLDFREFIARNGADL